MRQSGWQRSALERIAVGVGPGSFVGLRVGIALAQGLGLGLRVPVVGVGSLRSLSEAVPSSRTERRLALLDARRDELFTAVYAADGSELVAPSLWPRSEARARVEALGPGLVIVGDVASTLDLRAGSVFTGERCFPSAERCARIARLLDPEASPATPHYRRGPGADLLQSSAVTTRRSRAGLIESAAMSGDALERAKLLSRYGRRIAAGTVLFRDGEPADHALLIEQGRVRLFEEIGGMERSLRLVRQGELFGESALVSGSLRARRRSRSTTWTRWSSTPRPSTRSCSRTPR